MGYPEFEEKLVPYWTYENMFERDPRILSHRNGMHSPLFEDEIFNFWKKTFGNDLTFHGERGANISMLIRDDIPAGSELVVMQTSDEDTCFIRYVVSCSDSKILRINGVFEDCDGETVKGAVAKNGVDAFDHIVRQFQTDMYVVLKSYFTIVGMSTDFEFFVQRCFNDIMNKIRGMFYDANVNEIVHDIGLFPVTHVRNVVWSFCMETVTCHTYILPSRSNIYDWMVYVRQSSYKLMESVLEIVYEFHKAGYHFFRDEKYYMNEYFSLLAFIKSIHFSIPDLNLMMSSTYKLYMTIKNTDLYVDKDGVLMTSDPSEYVNYAPIDHVVYRRRK